MTCSEQNERDRWGALEPWRVAALSGLDEAELERWRESGLLPASVKNDEPIEFQREFDEPPHYYNWTDHFRVLAAAKLLQLGLPETELPQVFAAFDNVCRNWPTRFVPRDMEPVFPNGVDFHRYVAERRHEYSLGRLYEFADIVEMDPARATGAPVLHRTGLQSESLWIDSSAGADADRVAAEWGVTAHQARRAIEFECALRSIRPADALLD